jgi:hypothetical protein
MVKSARKPPIHVPLPFETFVEGMLKIDPRQLPKKVRPGASKTAKKPAAKKKARKRS